MGLKKSLIGVVGYGTSGKALACEALRWVEEGRAAGVMVFDDVEPKSLPKGVSYGGAVGKVKKADLGRVWMSPGIAPSKTGLDKKRLTGELDLAQAHVLAHQKVAAITGTNGKTTTTELLTHLLQGAGIQTRALGNIGTPWLEGLDPKVEVYVVETSSFQLELIRDFHPNVAVITNIKEDHLDWHGGKKKYAAAKWRIARQQNSDDFLILGMKKHPPAGAKIKSKVLRINPPKACIKRAGDDLVVQAPVKATVNLEGWKLQGLHNEKNLKMAVLAALALGAKPESLEKSLARFEAAPHRQQDLGVLGGLRFVNDSKGTNPHAVASALENFPGAVLLFGGYDKGLDCSDFLNQALPSLKGLALFGPLGARLMDEVPSHPRVRWGKTLADAFQQAVSLAQPGDTILLSPGSSSFDEFKDYNERGQSFMDLARRYSHAPQP